MNKNNTYDLSSATSFTMSCGCSDTKKCKYHEWFQDWRIHWTKEYLEEKFQRVFDKVLLQWFCFGVTTLYLLLELFTK